MQKGSYVKQITIQQRQDEIQERLKQAYRDLDALQAECQHPNARKINRSDTGNWCRQDDAYWRECSCPDCGKKWNEDQ